MSGLSREEILARFKAAEWDYKNFPLYLTMTPDEEELDLLFKHRETVAEYRLFMKEVYSEDHLWESTDFSGLTVGYLVAKGVPSSDAFTLSTFLRYNLQYFELDPKINERKP